jgi:hypothetical protein
METTYLKIIRQSYIFQVGTILELPEGPDGYCVPDIGNGSAGIINQDAVKRVNVVPSSENYTGNCVLTRVSNFGRGTEAQENATQDIVKPEQVRIIHYPDSQQLYFHMPQYAYHAGHFTLIDGSTGEIMEQTPVRDKLNGSTMILMDTLPLKPGFYTIEADWPNGWTHQIKFIKFIAGLSVNNLPASPGHVEMTLQRKETQVLPAYIQPVSRQWEIQDVRPEEAGNGYKLPPGNVSVVQNNLEHRLFDSNGLEIENGINSNARMKDISSELTPSVKYYQNGRGGTITYSESETSIILDWEFAAGNAVVLILIPEEEHWAAATKTPLDRRNEILTYVAEQVIRDQVPSGHFAFYSNTISIYRSPGW